jgi:hypothetical protein
MKTYRLLLCLAVMSAAAGRAFASADDGLPPLPIDRSQPGIASITDDSSAEPVTKKWSIRYRAETRSIVLACTATYTFNGKAGTTRDYFVPISVDQLSNAAGKFSKAEEWAKLTKDRKPPAFRKSMGSVDGGEWVFVWTGERAVLMAQKVTLAEADWHQFGRLIPSAKDVIGEQSALQKSGQDFIDSLK